MDMRLSIPNLKGSPARHESGSGPVLGSVGGLSDCVLCTVSRYGLQEWAIGCCCAEHRMPEGEEEPRAPFYLFHEVP
jgi:hypothetical protein